MKKRISVILALALTVSLLGSFPVASLAEASNLYGDVNGDGEINSQDAVLFARYLAKWPSAVIDTLEAADLNDDEKQNSSDAVMLARYLAKWELPDTKIGQPIVTELKDPEVSLRLPDGDFVLNQPVSLICDVKVSGSPELTYVYTSGNPDAVSVAPDGTLTAKSAVKTDISVYVRAYYAADDKTLVGSATIPVQAVDLSEKTDIVNGAYSLLVVADEAPKAADYLVSEIKNRLGFDGTVSVKPDADSGNYAIVLDMKNATAPALGIADQAAQINSDGFILKASGKTLTVLANTADGMDRGVRALLNQYADEQAKTLTVPSELAYAQSVGAKIKKLTVGGNSIEEYSVVRPADSSESMAFAAEELVSYIQQATGVTLPIVESASSDKVIELAASSDEKYGDDGFTIRSENGKVLISGAAQRGVLYGVYEFLEDYVGWRFIFEDLEYVYSADIRDIPDGISDTQIPVFYDRDSQCHSYDGDHLGSAVKRKINSWKNRGALEKSAKKYGLGVGPVGTAHTYANYLSGLENSQNPCLTDNAVYEECLKNVLAKIERTLANGYTVPLISVSQMDSYNRCQCNRCNKVNSREEGGSRAGTTVRFVNKIADAISEVYPETGVWTLSYQWTREPTVTKVNDNVTIMWAFEGCYNHPLNAGECSSKGIGYFEKGFPNAQNNTNYDSYLKGWRANAKNVYCWYYPQCYSFYLCPIPIWDVNRENYRYIAENGVTGIYAESYYGGDPMEGYGFDRMNVYLLAKLAWNPYMSQSEYETLTDEYLAAAYGSGWRYLREYLDMWVEAGDLSGCWMGNFNQPQEIVSLDYYSKNYEKMCELFDQAEKYADTEAQAALIQKFRCHMEYLALCGDYQSQFVSGDDAQKAAYQQRYSELYHFIKDNNIPITWNGTEQMPESDVVTETPMQWYLFNGDTMRN